MQRLYLDDLVGHVLEKEPWEVINLPAIAQDDENLEIRNRLGSVTLPAESRRIAAFGAGAARGTGWAALGAQYLQAPVPLGGGIVKAEWLCYYAPEEKPEKFDAIVQSWDTANKESELADYSAARPGREAQEDLFAPFAA